jgi:hypothetical protein
MSDCLSVFALAKFNTFRCNTTIANAWVVATEGLKSYAGYISPPFENKGPATHALVFILHGLTVPWKQTVAYYLTGNSTTGKQLWEVCINS